MVSKLKIAIIHPFFEVGGMERVAVLLAKYLKRNNNEVDILVWKFKKNYKTIANVRQINYIYFSFLPFEINVLLNTHNFLKFKDEYDLFIITGIKNFLLAKALSFYKPVIHYIHYPPYQSINKPLLDFFRRSYNLVFIMLNKVVIKNKKNLEFACNSKFTQEENAKIYPFTPRIIYPPTDTNFFKPTTNQEEKYILLTGRITPFKKFELALKKLKDISIPIILAGRAVDINYLNWLKKNFPFVQFVLNPSDKELLELYRNCAVYIFTNPQEHFGIVPCEAMACEKVVMVPKGAGISELIKNDYNGFVFNADYSDFEEKLKKALKAYKKLKRNARKIVKENCSLENFGNSFLEIIERSVN